MVALAYRLDQALLALSAGNRRTILELVRDEPGAVTEMAQQFGLTPGAVAQDISLLHLAEYEEQHDALAGRYDPLLLAGAGLAVGDRVLDVGCGTGPSTRLAARAVDPGAVLGVDVSGPMVKRAREHNRADRLANLAYEQADAQHHLFEPGSFDVVLSRFGAQYFSEPEAAFANLGRALRPGGRLALVTWRDLADNPWMADVRDAVALGRPAPALPAGTPGAFGLADPALVRRVLAGAGFVDVAVDDAREPVTFGPDATRAFAFVSTLGFAKDLLAHVRGAERREALARLRAVLEAHAGDAGVWFPAAAWLVTARRP